MYTTARTPTEIRRTAGGGIDMHHYERRARRLRARAMTRWAKRVLRALVQGWMQLRERIRVQRELSSLDERALRDIGLSPGDIPAVASGRFTHDPTRRRRQNDLS